MIDYRTIIKDREIRIRLIDKLRVVPTVPYLKIVYRVKTGRRLNLKHPVGFNEKLNYLKLHDIHPEYTDFVDKYEVRKIVAERLGKEYLFPLIGVWDNFDDIRFSELPEEFVIKCSHDSGSAKIVRNKSEINIEELRSFYRSRLHLNAYNLGREYPYKNVKPRIIVEKYMCDENGNAPSDYKFFCFNGEPRFLFVATDRETNVTHTVFDMKFNRVPVNYVHEPVSYKIKKPSLFDEMKDVARKLSKGMRFARIDLYEVNDRIYFGEYTFFPAGGFYLFHPLKWEKKFGDFLEIDDIYE